jgi:hypothetical protein
MSSNEGVAWQAAAHVRLDDARPREGPSAKPAQTAVHERGRNSIDQVKIRERNSFEGSNGSTQLRA